jgi:type IV secretory pathway protease TraF
MPRCRRGGLLVVTTGAVGALMLGILVAGAGGLRVNATASMPRGIWRVEAARTRIKRGEVVSVCLARRPRHPRSGTARLYSHRRLPRRP